MSVSEELHKGEKVIKQINPSRWAYFSWYLLGALFLIPLITLSSVSVLGLVIIFVTELVRRATAYYVTDRRVIYEYQFLSRKTSSAMYEKIQDLHFTQGLVEKSFGVGTLHINTAGTTFVEIQFRGIENPVAVKRMIEEYMLKQSDRR